MAELEAHATERIIMMLDRLRGVFDSDAEIARAGGRPGAALALA